MLLALTVADERMLQVPVFAGLAAMVATAWLLAVAQTWWRRRQGRAQHVELAPRAVAEPRSHITAPTPHPYDWSREPNQGSR